MTPHTKLAPFPFFSRPYPFYVFPLSSLLALVLLPPLLSLVDDVLFPSSAEATPARWLFRKMKQSPITGRCFFFFFFLDCIGSARKVWHSSCFADPRPA